MCLCPTAATTAGGCRATVGTPKAPTSLPSPLGADLAPKQRGDPADSCCPLVSVPLPVPAAPSGFPALSAEQTSAFLPRRVWRQWWFVVQSLSGCAGRAGNLQRVQGLEPEERSLRLGSGAPGGRGAGGQVRGSPPPRLADTWYQPGTLQSLKSAPLPCITPLSSSCLGHIGTCLTEQTPPQQVSLGLPFSHFGPRSPGGPGLMPNPPLLIAVRSERLLCLNVLPSRSPRS